MLRALALALLLMIAPAAVHAGKVTVSVALDDMVSNGAELGTYDTLVSKLTLDVAVTDVGTGTTHTAEFKLSEAPKSVTFEGIRGPVTVSATLKYDGKTALAATLFPDWPCSSVTVDTPDGMLQARVGCVSQYVADTEFSTECVVAAELYPGLHSTEIPEDARYVLAKFNVKVKAEGLAHGGSRARIHLDDVLDTAMDLVELALKYMPPILIVAPVLVFIGPTAVEMFAEFLKVILVAL
ncbi:hypothetical protein [Methanopyrus kandleri]